MFSPWVPSEPDRSSHARQPVVPRVLDPGSDAVVLRNRLRAFAYDDLVAAWESSARLLRSEVDLDRVLALARLRALILDELERRSPRRFQRLLRAGGPRDRARRRRRR